MEMDTAVSAQSPPKAPIVTGADGTKFKIVKVKMPDGTLKKVKRRLTTDEITAMQTAQALGAGVVLGSIDAIESSNQVVDGRSAETTIPVPIGESEPRGPEEPAQDEEGDGQPVDINALNAQDNFYKHKRRHKFKQSLMRGLARGVASTALSFPVFEHGDESAGSDFSDSGDSGNDDDDDDDDNGHGEGDGVGHGEESEKGHDDAHGDDHQSHHSAGAAHDSGNDHHDHAGKGSAYSRELRSVTDTCDFQINRGKQQSMLVA
jgi:hypothetical protein